MSRMLLVGRSGSGKTSRVVAEVRQLLDRHDAQGHFERFQVIVPTYSQAEHLKRRLLRWRGVAGEPAAGGGLDALLDRGIGTFEQFAERETGERLHALAPAPVQDALALQALEDDDFPDFREVRRFPGFRRAALRFVKEIKSGEPEPGEGAVAAAAERLAAASEGLPGARGRKLLGLARMLAAYQVRLSAAGLFDHEDLLRRLLLRLRDRPPEELRFFALDGFTDLTQVQERIVQIVAGSADRALVTLLGDHGGDREGPFAASAGLLGRLMSASGFGLQALGPPRRFAGDLLRVEERASGAELVPRPMGEAVRFVAGADAFDEADRVARICLGWSMEGVARSEILVVVRRLDSETGERVLDALRRHGVPHRRAGGAPLLGVPAARTALRVLRLLSRADAAGEVLDLIRCGAARGVADGEADRLFAEARPAGISSPDELRRCAHELGLRGATAWLDALADARLPPDPATPVGIARALLSALPTLVTWSYEGEVPGELAERAATDAAAMRRVRDLLAQVVRALGATGRSEVPPRTVMAGLDAAASDARCAARDQRVDVVNVVDAEEARQWEAEAVVVAGLRMGEFPSGVREDLFVADHDRKDIEKTCGVRLPARMDEALRRERLLFYAAVTRARSRLVLTRPLVGNNGDAVMPSPFLEALHELVPDGERVDDGAGRTPGDVRPAAGETVAISDLQRTALSVLAERHVRGGEGEHRARIGIDLVRTMLTGCGETSEGATTSGMARVSGMASADVWVLLRAADVRLRPGEEARLATEGPAAAHMARARRRSASSLAAFGQCAYKHFAGKGLGLRSPEHSPEDGLDPLRQGTIAHAALQSAFEDGARTESEVGEAFDAVWLRETERVRPGLSVERARAALRRAVVQLVVTHADASLVAGFEPVRF